MNGPSGKKGEASPLPRMADSVEWGARGNFSLLCPAIKTRVERTKTRCTRFANVGAVCLSFRLEARKKAELDSDATSAAGNGGFAGFSHEHFSKADVVQPVYRYAECRTVSIRGVGEPLSSQNGITG